MAPPPPPAPPISLLSFIAMHTVVESRWDGSHCEPRPTVLVEAVYQVKQTPASLARLLPLIKKGKQDKKPSILGVWCCGGGAMAQP